MAMPLDCRHIENVGLYQADSVADLRIGKTVMAELIAQQRGI